MIQSISCPVTTDQLAQIDAMIAWTGQTRSEWLHRLMCNALGESPANLRQLAERVKQLEQAQATVRLLQLQVEALIQHTMPDVVTPVLSVPLPGSGATLVTPSTRSYGIQCADQANQSSSPMQLSASQPPNRQPHGSAVLDVPSNGMMEDEPDEVLYAFLQLPQSSGKQQVITNPSDHHYLSSASDKIYGVEDEPDEILYDFLDEDERPF